MKFAQLVIGPPGSGKSTFCDGMQQFLNAIDRKCAVINLDPANDATNYPCALDIRDLVPLEEVMEQEELGPNGGVLYALEELEHNWDWMEQSLKRLNEDYLVIDCPGQVELFTHHTSLPNIFHRMEKLGYRLIVLQLLDSHALSQPSLWISSLLLTLRSMLNLPYPTLNVLSKIDNLSRLGPLPFNLDFYTEVQDLTHLLPHLEAEQAGLTLSELTSDPTLDPETVLSTIRDRAGHSRWTRLNEALVQLIEDFGLVAFQPLAVEDKRSMAALVRAIDRASGFVFSAGAGADADGANNAEALWSTAMGEGWGQMSIADVQERWIDRREELDEEERRAWQDEAREAGATAKAGQFERGVAGGRVPTVKELEAFAKARERDGQGTGNGDGDDGDADLEALQEEFLRSTNAGRGGGPGVVRKK